MKLNTIQVSDLPNYKNVEYYVLQTQTPADYRKVVLHFKVLNQRLGLTSVIPSVCYIEVFRRCILNGKKYRRVFTTRDFTILIFFTCETLMRW